MKWVMTLPAMQYTSAIHTMKPGISHDEPWNSKPNAPDSPHKMPTKLTSVTTAFSSPMLRPTL